MSRNLTGFDEAQPKRTAEHKSNVEIFEGHPADPRTAPRKKTKRKRKERGSGSGSSSGASSGEGEQAQTIYCRESTKSGSS